MREPDLQHDFETADEPDQLIYGYDQLAACDSSAAAYSTFGAEFNPRPTPNPEKPQRAARSRFSNRTPTIGKHSATDASTATPKSRRPTSAATDNVTRQHRNHSPSQLRLPIAISLLLGFAALAIIFFLLVSDHHHSDHPSYTITTLRDESHDHFLSIHPVPLPSPQRQRVNRQTHRRLPD